MKRRNIIILILVLISLLQCKLLKMYMSKVIHRDKEKDKFKAYYHLMYQWVEIKRKGLRIDEFLLQKGYGNIALYGIGDVGKAFLKEMEGGCVYVAYAIDKNADDTAFALKVVSPDSPLEPVDAIIVSAIFAYDDIHSNLSAKVDCPIIPLDDLLYEMY